ncbi:MAG TPA: glycosyltransferase [Candidatus Sulfotelmatobacter sp.]|nr:glycosyltransferase [Candidatus Sulfotelmatobacter sp.]
MILLKFILAALAVLSFELVLWQFWAARKFPLHIRIADSAFSPAVSILKPLKGCDATTAASLESWFNQNYAGPIQILFGVAGVEDPVCGIVRELMGKYPNADAQMLVCGEALGMNAKVSTLIQLERAARHGLILVSDADVRVPEDFLGNIVAPLRETEVALVNCFYRIANPATRAMEWEAVAINADFWSQVLQSQMLKPLDFALGAAILQRRKSLEQAGGFAAFANCLADDYQIGNQIAKNGGRIALCPVVVECWDAPMNWREVWKHQLRWARTIRVCQPSPYFLSILSNGTLWPLLWLIYSLLLGKALYALAAFILLLARIAMAGSLQRKFNEGSQRPAPFWLVPVKDLLNAAIWAIAFCGNKIEWRGRKMRLRRDGNLEPVLPRP